MVTSVSPSRTAVDARQDAIPLSALIAALSRGLDLAEGQPEGHALRATHIGMRLADEIGLGASSRSALLYALLLKDLGACAIAVPLSALFGADERIVRREWIATDGSRLSQILQLAARCAAPGTLLIDRVVRIVGISLRGRAEVRRLSAARADHASGIARMMGFTEETTAAVAATEERWDGQGAPRGLAGEAIPLLGRVVALAQTLEIARRLHGPEGAYDLIWSRRERWYDPTLVDALFAFRKEDAFWDRVASAEDPPSESAHGEPLALDDTWLDRIVAGFARVVDTKSPWTAGHSPGVAALAEGIGDRLGIDGETRRDLVRAALLHDLGKLGMPSTVGERAGNLTEGDRMEIRRHPALTRDLLARAPGLSHLASLAGAHHERIDGRGYPDGLAGDDLSPSMRALIVAVVAEALVSDRPFRAGLSPERALAVMRRDVGRGLCPDCFEALESFVGALPEGRPGLLAELAEPRPA